MCSLQLYANNADYLDWMNGEARYAGSMRQAVVRLEILRETQSSSWLAADVTKRWNPSGKKGLETLHD